LPEALVAPKRSQERRKDAATAQSASFWSKAWAARRSARTKLFVVLGLAVSIGVPVNALYFQDARHPAPLFQAVIAPGEPVRHAAAQAPAAPAKTEAAKPEIKKAEPARSGQVSDQIAQLLGVGGAKTPAKGKPVAAKDAHQKDAAAKGQIDKTATGKIAATKPNAAKPVAPKAAEAKGDGAKNAKAKTAERSEAQKKDAAAKPADKSVTLAQRALAKLGYSLHQDGVYGGTTREAIEKFERANGMPAKGELTPKVLKLLGQRSGVAMR
jgi:hypothetical protein